MQKLSTCVSLDGRVIEGVPVSSVGDKANSYNDVAPIILDGFVYGHHTLGTEDFQRRNMLRCTRIQVVSNLNS